MLPKRKKANFFSSLGNSQLNFDVVLSRNKIVYNMFTFIHNVYIPKSSDIQLSERTLLILKEFYSIVDISCIISLDYIYSLPRSSKKSSKTDSEKKNISSLYLSLNNDIDCYIESNNSIISKSFLGFSITCCTTDKILSFHQFYSINV